MTWWRSKGPAGGPPRRWRRWLWTLLLLPGLGLAQLPVAEPEVRVIVDVSGSMRGNDPEQLAASAVELLAALLPDGVRAGVWTFGTEVATPLPLAGVDDAWRRRAMALRPDLVEYQQYTDIEAAVAAAAEPPAEGERHLVLLTDGVIDLPPARGDKPAIDGASRRRLLESLAPDLARQGVVAHAIAFSADADLALVAQLGRLTGGLPVQVDSPESLPVAFLDIVERIFPTDQVPLDEGRFVIEPGVEAFSALLFHAPEAGQLTLVAPDGSRHDAEAPPPGARWQEAPRFSLLRVTEPARGEWRLEGALGAQSRIGVRGTVSLHIGPLPATLYPAVGVPLEAWLARRGEPWAEAPEDLAIGAALLDAEGRVLAEAPLQRDGERFVGELVPPAELGPARLRLRAEGEGFLRQRVLAVNVQPLLGLLVDAESGTELAASARGQPDSERFHEDLATGRDGGELADSPADRFIDFINDLPSRAAALGREALPWLEQRRRALVASPGQQAVAGGLAILLLVALMLLRRTRRRQRRRVVHREDPHV